VKRRSFCRYVVLGSATVAGVVARDLDFAISSNYSQTKSVYKWVVLYWMPYDNDLSRFGEPIIEMITRGTRNSETAVVVQSDYWGDPKMRRRQIVNESIQEMDVSGEDSSDVSAFSAYLDWAYQAFEAEHWAVIVVGHGGKINEVSPDDHKATSQNRTWMRVDQFANALSNFNQATDGRVELLFFQNCNKATLEVVYEARNCARYTLASQFLLGAPNYYYEGFLNYLQNPLVGGREAAIAITEHERIDMYHTLTLVDNKAVKGIPEKLSRVLQSLGESQVSIGRQLEDSTYHYFGERHCDALVILGNLCRIKGHGQNELTELTNFLRSSVITHYKTGGKLYRRHPFRKSNLEDLCGLSLYLPEKEGEIYRYSSMALYQEVDLVSIYREIFTNI